MAIEKILFFLGASLCHQHAGNSFVHVGDFMPLCSRCTGMYTAFFVSLTALALLDRSLKKKFVSNKILFVTLFFLLVMGADVASTSLGIYQADNMVRFLTGFMFGWCLPLLLVPLKNTLLFKGKAKSGYLSKKPKFFLWVSFGILSIILFYITLEYFFGFWSFVSVLGLLIFVSNIVLILFFAICPRCSGKVSRGFMQCGVYMLSGLAAALLLSGFSIIRSFFSLPGI